MKKNLIFLVITAVVIALLVTGCVFFMNNDSDKSEKTPPKDSQTTESNKQEPAEKASSSPLAGKKFYIDSQREVVKMTEQYKNLGDLENARMLEKIASQPSAIWLTGPNPSDINAERDVVSLNRTSTEASSQNTVPIYVLYAIPSRDACAEFSKGGFSNDQDYLVWVGRLVSSLKTQAVFIVEPDAVGHTIRTDCLDSSKVDARYRLLAQTLAKLNASPKVLASYLDAGHSEWFPDPSVLQQPLIKSGIAESDGVAVNVSNFIAASELSKWSKGLVSGLGEGKAVVIDTSRNGKGTVDPSIKGDDRWCNPGQRGLGIAPTGNTDVEYIDAYLWIKIPGESDGSCRGNPAAGTFVPSIAIELARNAIE